MKTKGFSIKKGPTLKAIFHLQNDQIHEIELYPGISEGIQVEFIGLEISDKCSERVHEWINDYAGRKEPSISLPLFIHPFPSFTSRVLELVRQLPFGSVASYGEIATKMGNPKASRAVGNACGRNPFPLIVPCHRVLAANRHIGGFSCDPEIKKILLAYEGVFCL